MDDIELARRAAAGERGAFATLYDRHERRAYNLCYRITGSPDDAADATQETFLKMLERLPSLTGRDVEFGSYLLSAARNASYDAIARRRRTAPAGEIPDSAVPVAGGVAPGAPDEGPLRAAHAEAVREANALLPPRQREALALRELEELSYDQVAEVMGMNRNSVAQLISRARLNLRDGLRRGALVSIPAASADCETALPLLALAHDGELSDGARADWLAGHLVDCAVCRVRVDAMADAGTAYRLWLPLVPGFWLRTKVAKAAERAHARSRLSRRRRLGAAGGVGVLVLVGAAGLATAEVVHAPVRALVAATPTPAPAPAHVEPAVLARYTPRPAKHRATRIVAVRVPTATPTPAPTPVAEAAAAPPPVERRVAAAPRRVHRPAPEPTAEPAELVPPAEPPAADPPPPDPPDPTCPAGGTAAPVPGCPQPPRNPQPPGGPILVSP